MDEADSPKSISLRAAELAYGEAQRGADRASSTLDGFRARAATVFTVGVLATTFFGQAIGPDLRFMSWAAICVFVVGVAGPGIVIMLPLKSVSLGLTPAGLLSETETGATDAEIVGKAATNLEGAVRKSRDRIAGLMVLLQLQCLALAIEIVLWTVDLAGR